VAFDVCFVLGISLTMLLIFYLLYNYLLNQELDRQILEALTEKEDELQKVQTARKEKAKADASWMKKVSKRVLLVRLLAAFI